MSTTTITIIREAPDTYKSEVEVDIAYDRSAYGIDFIASIDGLEVQLTDEEREMLYEKIWEEENEE